MRVAGREPGTAGVAQPKYQMLHGQLTELARSLPAGSAFPTERELCEAYLVSRSTVRQALQRLEAEQRIERHQGRGTFVARTKIEQSLELTSHTEDMRSRGITPGSKLVDLRREIAEPEVMAMLELAAGADVLRVERLRLADEEPIAIETVYLDAERFDGLSDALGEAASLYQLLETGYGVELATADETIEAVVAAGREVGLLGIPLGSPLLLLSRRTLDVSGAPTEYVRSLYRGDRFRFRTQIERHHSRTRPSGVALHEATIADVPGLARAYLASVRATGRRAASQLPLDTATEAEVAAWLGQVIGAPGQLTVAASSLTGVLVGFVRFGDDPDDPRDGHVFSLVVSAPAGADLGRLLLERAIAEVELRAKRSLTLWAFEADEAARRLYQACGFAPDGARRIEPRRGSEEVRLRREIQMQGALEVPILAGAGIVSFS